MKKLLVSGIALAGMLMVAGGVLAIRSSTQVKAEDASGEEVKTLINGFLTAGENKYTKKTQIFMTPEAQAEYKDCFHAGANALERTTYYDEVTDALLMGNYDGTFGDGTTGINSGYRKSGENTMAHFFYKGHAEPSVADLYTNYTDTYTVANTTPNAFFKNLTDIATEAAVKTTWTKGSENDFYYHFTDISIDEVTGDYNDGFLKTIQYFAAPMWLQNTAYFSADYVQIKKCTDWLSIRLYVSSANKDKLTVYDDGNGLLAEARVFSGLRFDEPEYKVTGSFDGWTTGKALTYHAHIRENVQYRVELTLVQWTAFGINYHDYWHNYFSLENKEYFEDNGNNIGTTLTERSYTIYFKAESHSVYIAVEEIDSVDVKITVPADWYNDDCDGIAVYVWNPKEAEWPGKTVSTSAKETVVTTTVGGYNTHLIVCRLKNGACYQQTQNINLLYSSTSIQINNIVDVDGEGKLSNYSVTKTAE